MSSHPPLPPNVKMMHMITGFWTSCCIYTAAKLSIADHLYKKPMTVEELATVTQTHQQSLFRLMRALTSIGVFNYNEQQQFELTPLGKTLQSSIPGSMHAMAIMQLGDHLGAWSNLVYSVKTGEPSFDMVEGMSVWDYYEAHHDEGLNFMNAMTGMTETANKNIIPAYDFSQFKVIIDVGGGNGALLFSILDVAPDAKGIVFDLPYVTDETNKLINNSRFNGRCSVEPGNFFEAVPMGADAYIMKMILHDWNDEKSKQILINCSMAMVPGSKLLIIDAVIPEDNEPHTGKFMDINMMAMTGGRERTEKEFAELLSKAGLRLHKVINTLSPSYSIVEAIK